MEKSLYWWYADAPNTTTNEEEMERQERWRSKVLFFLDCFILFWFCLFLVNTLICILFLSFFYNFFVSFPLWGTLQGWRMAREGLESEWVGLRDMMWSSQKISSKIMLKKFQKRKEKTQKASLLLPSKSTHLQLCNHLLQPPLQWLKKILSYLPSLGSSFYPSPQLQQALWGNLPGNLSRGTAHQKQVGELQIFPIPPLFEISSYISQKV